MIDSKTARPVSGLVALLVVTVLGCSPLKAPEGVVCEAIHEAGSNIQATLDSAAAGDCVLLPAGEHPGGLSIPAGVSLAAAKGAEAILTGTGDDSWMIRLAAGSSLSNLVLAADGDQAVLVEGVDVKIENMKIEEASIAVLAICPESTCREDSMRVELIGVQTLEGRIGVWARGANVRVSGGSIEGHGSTSISNGYGVMASHGAHLELLETRIENNEVGILMDGEATTGVLTDLLVAGNTERGIWLQGLRGSALHPAVRIEGSSTTIERNRMVGIGMTDALGIIVIDSVIRDTIESPVQVDEGGIAHIGDGIAVLARSGDVRIEGSEISMNARAQVLVNEGSVGIIVIDSVIMPSDDGYGIVYQDTAVGSGMSDDDIEYDVGLPTSSSSLDLPDI